MADFEKIRTQVKRCLRYDYPGSPDDGDGANDEVWINKKQKYEVDYAIARCLWECNATYLATDVEFIQCLEKKIHLMDHDGKGRCKRSEAYPALKHAIGIKQLADKIKKSK